MKRSNAAKHEITLYRGCPRGNIGQRLGVIRRTKRQDRRAAFTNKLLSLAAELQLEFNEVRAASDARGIYTRTNSNANPRDNRHE